MFQGSIVALVTPMLDDGTVDYKALKSLVDWHVDSGTDAIVSVGTTGESATLSVREHSEVIARTIEYANKRLPVIAGTGANSTDEAIVLTKNARAAGADACLLVTPYYNRPPQEGLYQHFRKIAESVDIAQILYNVPSRTSVDMTAETTARLAQIDNIIGTKESTTVERIVQLIELCPSDFMIVSGEDATALESIVAGGRGAISVTANVAPQLMHQMCKAALAGDNATAFEIRGRLDALNAALFTETSPIPTKWLLQQMGRIGSGIRLPLVGLSSASFDTVRDAATAAEIAL